MPVCEINTNLSKDKVPADLQQRVTKLICETIPGKTEERVTVMVHTDVQMCRGGTDEPNMTLFIWGIGCFDEERNPNYSEKFFNFFNTTLNLPDERIVIAFYDLPWGMVGHRPKPAK